LQCLDLPVDRGNYLGMAVTARDSDDSGEHVEIALASLVEQPLHVPLNNEQRLTIEGEDRRIHVLASHRYDFFPRWSGVGPGHMRRGRHAHRPARPSPAARLFLGGEIA